MPGPSSAVALGELATVAEKFSAAAEANRRLSAEVAAGIVTAGFARHFVPAAHGGADSTFTALTEALVPLAGRCASAAWCAQIYATSGRMASFLPPRGRAEVWAAGPDVPIAAALTPTGTATPADGGWVLSGRWHVLSGVDAAEWALLAAETVGGQRFLAVEAAHYTVEDTWHPVGMRGTGSNSVLLDEVFVPVHRSFPRVALVRGDAGAGAASRRAPLDAVAGLPFAAVVAGIAEHALGHWTESIAGQRSAGVAVRDTDAARELFARAALHTDVAGMLVARAAAAADDATATARFAGRSRRDVAYVAELARAVVDELFRAAGTRVQRSGHPLECAWRDVHAAASHLTLRTGPAAAGFAAQNWPEEEETP
ncbi:hydrolase [Amycolatopsis sp. NPDC051128]|uniref:hydrolase n=1 Tax=Amycolatopsis sp. NPDC051128 TaxID=3155412 RepID=UPI0034181AAE